MRRPAHRSGRVHRHDMARHQPVEQVAHAGELLLDAGRGQLAPQRLDPGRDVERLHASERGNAARLVPGQEVARRARIGAARMRIADGDGEELKRSEEHTSELQSLMRISYAVFCLKKKTNTTEHKEIR